MPHSRNTDKYRSVFGWISSIVLIATLGWTTYFLATAPDQVALRMNLSNEAIIGSKWRIVILPTLMILVYVIAGQAEKMGVINTPYKDPVSPEEAKQAAAGLRVFAMLLFVLLLLAMVSGGYWNWSQSVFVMITAVSFSAMTLLTYLFLSRRR